MTVMRLSLVFAVVRTGGAAMASIGKGLENIGTKAAAAQKKMDLMGKLVDRSMARARHGLQGTIEDTRELQNAFQQLNQRGLVPAFRAMNSLKKLMKRDPNDPFAPGQATMTAKRFKDALVSSGQFGERIAKEAEKLGMLRQPSLTASGKKRFPRLELENMLTIEQVARRLIQKDKRRIEAANNLLDVTKKQVAFAKLGLIQEKIEGVGLGAALPKFEETSGFTKFLSSNKEKVLKFAKSLAVFGEFVKRAAFELTAMSVALLAFGAKVTAVFAEFELSLTRAAIVATAKAGFNIDLMTEAMEKFGLKAREVGRTTFFSMQEAVVGMFKLGQAGLDVNAILENMETVTNFATLGLLSLEDAGAIALRTMNAFALGTDQLTRITDVLTLASFNANATINDLGLAMKKVGPLAAKLGFSLEEVAAALGVLANAGLAGTEGGTAVRNMMLRLLNPSAKALVSLQKIGISAFEITSGMLSFEEVLRRIKMAMEAGTIAGADLIDQYRGGLITMEEMSAQFAANSVGAADLANIFQARAAPAVIAMVASLDDAGTGFVALEQKMRNAKGVAKDAADALKNTVAFQLKQLKNIFLEIGVAIGRFFVPILKAVFKIIDNNRSVLDNLSDGFLRLGEHMAGFLQVVLAPFKSLIPVIGLVILALKKNFEIAFGGKTGELLKQFWREAVQTMVVGIGVLLTILSFTMPQITLLAIGFRTVVTVAGPFIIILLKVINILLRLVLAVATAVSAIANLALIETILAGLTIVGEGLDDVLGKIIKKFEELDKMAFGGENLLMKGGKKLLGSFGFQIGNQGGISGVAKKNMLLPIHAGEPFAVSNPRLDQPDARGGSQQNLSITYNVSVQEFDFRDFVEQTRREQMRMRMS